MLCPVADAISASVAPLIAARVTKVPRRSLKVMPVMPALLHDLRHDDEKPCEVQGFSSELRSIMGERRGVASSISRSGADTVISMPTPVLPCLSLILPWGALSSGV